LKFSCQENFEDLWELANGHPDGVCNSPRKVADCFLWLMPFVNLNNGYNYISYNHDPTMSNDFRDGIL